jgi:putative serine protease PepD
MTENQSPENINQPESINRQFLFDSPYQGNQVEPVASEKPARLGAKAVALVAAGAIFGGALGSGVGIWASNYVGEGTNTVVVNNSDNVNWVTGAAAKALPSVVTISVAGGGSAGSGSGIALTADGYILTNTHVVTLDGSTGTPTIEVKTAEGKIFNAKLIGTDPTNDLAVIKVTAGYRFVPATFADSTKVNIGDEVVAIGAPLGLENTITSGVVSYLNRTIQVSNSAAPENGSGGLGGLQFFNGGSGQSAISLNVIQTDAAINPGNSGGALVNSQGEVIGVNVAIASAGSTSGQAGSIGVGFAIPANAAKRISAELMAGKKASHALLGAQVTDANSSDVNAAGFSTGAAVVALTPGGAAETAGIQKGDIITEFNGQTITGASELTAAVRSLPAGSKASLKLIRAGVEQTISVVLGDAADLK